MKNDDVPRSILVGLNQTKKAVRAGRAARVLLAVDADESLRKSVKQLCEEFGVEAEESGTMAALGTLCGIEVGCAVCAYLR